MVSTHNNIIFWMKIIFVTHIIGISTMHAMEIGQDWENEIAPAMLHQIKLILFTGSLDAQNQTTLLESCESHRHLVTRLTYTSFFHYLCAKTRKRNKNSLDEKTRNENSFADFAHTMGEIMKKYKPDQLRSILNKFHIPLAEINLMATNLGQECNVPSNKNMSNESTFVTHDIFKASVCSAIRLMLINNSEHYKQVLINDIMNDNCAHLSPWAKTYTSGYNPEKYHGVY